MRGLDKRRSHDAVLFGEGLDELYLVLGLKEEIVG